MQVNFKTAFNRKGEEMVEASIVLPIVILVIMLLIRLCTFYLECLISQTNLHYQMLKKWDLCKSPIIRTIENEKEINYMNKGLAEGLLRKNIKARAYSICEDSLVRIGGNLGQAMEK